MNEIDQVNIKGYFEENFAYLKFNELPNYKFSLNQNFSYLEQLLTLWNNEFFNQNKILSKDDDKIKKVKFYRMQIISFKLLELVKTSISNIINILDSKLLTYDKSLEDELYNNIENNRTNIQYNNIQKILEQIGSLLTPKFNNISNNKTTLCNVLPLNFTSYLFIKEGSYMSESDIQKFINEKLENESKNPLLDKVNIDTKIQAILEELYKNISNIRYIDKLINVILTDKAYENAFKHIPPPKEKDKTPWEVDKKKPDEMVQPIPFEEYDTKYLEFINNLLLVQYKSQPLLNKTRIKINIIKDDESSNFYLINEKFTIENIDKFQEYVIKYYKAKQSETIMDEFKINYLNYLNARSTDNYNPKRADILKGRQSGSQININEKDSEEQTKNKFASIIQDLNEIDKSYSSIQTLSFDQAKKIAENKLNIFLDKSIQSIFKKFIKNFKKVSTSSSQDDKDDKDDDTSKNRFKSFITFLNTLELNSIQWKDVNNKSENLRFMREYFSYIESSEKTSDLYILTLNLNLKTILTNSYVKYLINFISNDPSIMNVKDYQYNVSENIEGATESNILLPPYIGSDKKDCCYILVNKNDIIEFNKNNPDITNKQIFTNINHLDKLIKQIGLKSQNVDKKYKNPDGFINDIQLLNEIYFSPHPLKNIFNKYFHKNNVIMYKGKSYSIVDYKIASKSKDKSPENPSGLPSITNFNSKEVDKDGKTIKEKIYTVRMELTVIPSDLSVNLVNTIKATCPEKAKQLKDKYGDIMEKIPGFNKLYKKEFIPDKWHLNKYNKLIKRGLIEKGGSNRSRKRKSSKKNITFRFYRK